MNREYRMTDMGEFLVLTTEEEKEVQYLIEELRSGRYEQSTRGGYMHKESDGALLYCPLGVWIQEDMENNENSLCDEWNDVLEDAAIEGESIMVALRVPATYIKHPVFQTLFCIHLWHETNRGKNFDRVPIVEINDYYDYSFSEIAGLLEMGLKRGELVARGEHEAYNSILQGDKA